jgi:hypothetical protein
VLPIIADFSLPKTRSGQCISAGALWNIPRVLVHNAALLKETFDAEIDY